MDRNEQNWNWMTRDGLEIYSKAWLPAGKPKAVVCIIHGVGEHIGRYEPDATALTEAGYIVTGFDQRGFGRSAGQRGYTPNLNAYFDDIDLFLEEAVKRFPGLPRFLYGMSMGAILVLAYPNLRHADLKGVIAAAPGLKNALEKQKGKLFLTKALGGIIPAFSLDSGIDATMLSRDPNVVEAYIKDPLVHRTVTAGWGKAMLDAIALVYKNAPSYPVPLLLMHGTKDEIAYPTSSETYATLAPKDSTTVRMWDGFKHELHTDPEQVKVFKVMVDWLDQHIQQ